MSSEFRLKYHYLFHHIKRYQVCWFIPSNNLSNFICTVVLIVPKVFKYWDLLLKLLPRTKRVLMYSERKLLKHLCHLNCLIMILSPHSITVTSGNIIFIFIATCLTDLRRCNLKPANTSFILDSEDNSLWKDFPLMLYLSLCWLCIKFIKLLWKS